MMTWWARIAAPKPRQLRRKGGQASHAPRTLAHDTHATPSTTHHIPTSTYAARIAKTGSAHLGLAALCPLATSPSHITVVSRTAAYGRGYRDLRAAQRTRMVICMKRSLRCAWSRRPDCNCRRPWHEAVLWRTCTRKQDKQEGWIQWMHATRASRVIECTSAIAIATNVSGGLGLSASQDENRKTLTRDLRCVMA